jgi:tripartite-type tricarboxylate transporter receptor subunit TctC
MVKKLVAITGLLILAGVLVVSCTSKAQPASTPADFYKNKTMELVVTESPGSSTDIMTRFIASYLSGDTGASVVVTNRRDAGGMEGMNYLYRAKPDGLTVGTTSRTKAVSNMVLNDPAAVYEIDKFSYIMSIGRRQSYFFVSPEGPYQSVTGLQAAKNLNIGGSSPSGYVSLGGLSVIKILGLDAKVITGINGESERALAAKRGEIAGYVISLFSAKSSVDAGLVKPLFVLATERDPLMPDVPAITELVNLTGEDLDLVRLWETSLVGSNLLAASPGIPEDRLVFLRDLANQWVQDEGFREGISVISGYDVQEQEYLTGEEVTEVMLDMVAALDKFQDMFAELIEKYRA